MRSVNDCLNLKILFHAIFFRKVLYALAAWVVRSVRVMYVVKIKCYVKLNDMDLLTLC